MFPWGLETVWKLCNISTFLQRHSVSTLETLVRISSYALCLHLSLSSRILSSGSESRCPYVHSVQAKFLLTAMLLLLAEGLRDKASKPCERSGFNGIFMDPGTLWQQVTLLGLCRCAFCILPLYGNLTKVTVSLALSLLPLLRWYAVSLCTPRSSGSVDFSWLRL